MRAAIGPAPKETASRDEEAPGFWNRAWSSIRSKLQPMLRAPAGFRIIETFKDLTPAEFQKLEALAFEHGTNFLSYASIENDRSWLVMGDFEGIVGFLRAGKYIHLTGAPLCPAELRERMHEGMTKLSKDNRVVLSILWLERSEAEYFRSRGWDAVAVGRDCRVSLTECTWKGSDYSWLRRQESYCLRQGLEVREVTPSELPPEQWQALREELIAIDHEHLAPKTFNRQLKGWEGRPFEGEFGRRRLFIASEKGSQVTSAYLCCNPCKGGSAWSFEMYRSRPNSVRGVIPFLMLQTMRVLQKEKATDIDLCPVPAILDRFDWNPKHLLTNYILWAWRTFGNMYFDVHGIYHFRSRFRPQNDDCFRVDYPKSSPGVLLTFAIVAEMWRISPKNLIRATWGLVSRRKSLVAIPGGNTDPVATPIPLASEADAAASPASGNKRKVA